MRIKQLWLKLPITIVIAMIVMVGALFVSPQTHAQSVATSGQGDGLGVPYTTAKSIKISTQSVKAAKSHIVDTIPFWSSVFNYQGNPYPYQMVGTDPTAGSATTTVPTIIIPLKLTFSNGVTLDGKSKLKATLDSPIFQKDEYTSGKTQYGDAIQRAAFWSYVTKYSKNYHVLLGKPSVTDTVSLTVPAQVGQEVTGKRTGASIGLIDENWFDSQLQSIMVAKHISPKTLPIFLDYNTFLYSGGDPTQCCILGYHNALFSTNALGKSQIQTYMFGAYSDPGIFGSLPIEDIHGLSHEVSEWYNDPFVDNITPTWSSPLSPQYGCSNILEVGDPVVGIGFTVRGYHPEDEIFFSWFAKQVPSVAINGQYTYMGTFSAPSPTCTLQ